MSDTHFGFQTIDEKQKAQRVRGVFDSVASKYDVMNDLMSMGLHRLWKTYTIASSGVREGHKVLDIAGGVLVVSQFTLYGDARRGRRPAFTDALEPVAARALYEQSLEVLRQAGVGHVAAGVFGADMKVELLNDGPVTILLDSRKGF